MNLWCNDANFQFDKLWNKRNEQSNKKKVFQSISIKQQNVVKNIGATWTNINKTFQIQSNGLETNEEKQGKISEEKWVARGRITWISHRFMCELMTSILWWQKRRYNIDMLTLVIGFNDNTINYW